MARALRIGLAAAAALAAGVWIWQDAAGPRAFRPIRVAEADLERGARLYALACASCHGADLEGQPDWRTAGPDGVLPAPPHDETGHTWHHGDRLLFRYTRLGGNALMAERGVTDFRSGMPGFGETLSDGEIRDILAFVKSRWPAKQRAHQRRVSQAEATR